MQKFKRGISVVLIAILVISSILTLGMKETVYAADTTLKIEPVGDCTVDSNTPDVNRNAIDGIKQVFVRNGISDASLNGSFFEKESATGRHPYLTITEHENVVDFTAPEYSKTEVSEENKRITNALKDGPGNMAAAEYTSDAIATEPVVMEKNRTIMPAADAFLESGNPDKNNGAVATSLLKEVILNFTTDPINTSYVIRYGVEPGIYIDEVRDVTGSGYKFHTPVSQVPYYFVVSGENINGESIPSNEISCAANSTILYRDDFSDIDFEDTWTMNAGKAVQENGKCYTNGSNPDRFWLRYFSQSSDYN